MAGDDQTINENRSFRTVAEVMRIAAEVKRRRGHLAGAIGKTPEPADFFDKQFRALLYSGGALQPIEILRRRNQKFDEHATDWERAYSALVRPGARYLPIIDANGTVIGHYATMSAGYFTDLIIPFGAVQHRRDPYSPYYTADLVGLMDSGIKVFVHDRRAKPPEGWVLCDVLTTEHKLDVMTSIDGEVIHVTISSTGFVESVDYSPADIVAFGKLLAHLGKAVGTRLVKTLVRKTVAKEARVLAGPTRALAKESEKEAAKAVAAREGTSLFKGLRLGRGYDPRMGIPEEHLTAMIDAAKETECIAIFRANKASAIPLIRKGAHGKPMWAKFKTNPETGVLTATNAGEAAAANMNGAFVVGTDGIAYRTVTQGGKTIKETMHIKDPFWTVKPGQVLAADGKPIVGDYDLLGVAPIKSTGRNITAVPEDIAYGDWIGPDVKKYLNAVNKKGRLDEPRVLHGAQDGYGGNKKYMGLTDDTAYAVFPDGRTFVMVGKKEQQAFYDALGRQAKSPGAPVGVPGWRPTIVK